MRVLEVFRASRDDISSIRDLELEAFGFTWDEATFQRELARENGVTVVAKIGGGIVGSALLVWAMGEVQLNSIVLHPSVRGCGYSREFLGRLMAWCQERAQNWFTLEVKWNNVAACGLYRHFGFVTTARRKSYYRDGSDARIMWAGSLQSETFRKRLEPYRNSELESAS